MGAHFKCSISSTTPVFPAIFWFLSSSVRGSSTWTFHILTEKCRNNSLFCCIKLLTWAWFQVFARTYNSQARYWIYVGYLKSWRDCHLQSVQSKSTVTHQIPCFSHPQRRVSQFLLSARSMASLPYRILFALLIVLSLAACSAAVSPAFQAYVRCYFSAEIWTYRTHLALIQ